MELIDSIASLQQFAQAVQFPSHALILRPSNRETKTAVFKGLDSYLLLEQAFYECQGLAPDGKIWVETDMRAHYNPSRMSVIAELASNLADRLTKYCRICHTPGWGKIRHEKGLRCSWCKSPTELIKFEIFGCVKCNHEESKNRFDGLEQAEPSHCQYCNP